MDTTKRQNKAIINPSKNSLPSRTSPQKVEMKKASPNNAETSRGIVKAENKNSVQNGKKYIVKRTMVIESKRKTKAPSHRCHIHYCGNHSFCLFSCL